MAGDKGHEDTLFSALTDSDLGKMVILARADMFPCQEGPAIEMVGLSQKRGRQFLGRMVKQGAMQTSRRGHGEAEHTEYNISPAFWQELV